MKKNESMAENEILAALSAVIESRKQADPSRSYVASLHNQGLSAINDKVLEEATELVQAANEASVDHLAHEAADLWFHSLVLLSKFDLTHEVILDELHRRFGISGIDEKNARN